MGATSSATTTSASDNRRMDVIPPDLLEVVRQVFACPAS